MDILVLGDSDSAGAFNGGVSWPALVEAACNLAGHGPLSIRSIPFSAVPASSAAYAARNVSELRPDLVIVPVGAFGFTFGFVELRVQRLFGDRAARWYKRLEARLDARTRGAATSPRGLNRLGRSLSRRLIGTEPLTTRAQLTANFGDLFRALARIEDVDVIAFSYPGIGDNAHTRDAPRLRALFFADVKAAVESHHYSWVSLSNLFDAYPDWHAYALDELHFNETGHRRIAEVLLTAVTARMTLATG